MTTRPMTVVLFVFVFILHGLHCPPHRYLDNTHDTTDNYELV